MSRCLSLLALISSRRGAATNNQIVVTGTAQTQCCGDCNGDGSVTIDEILTTVNNALNGGASCH